MNTIDTLAYRETLIQNGVDEKLANAIAMSTKTHIMDEVVTKETLTTELKLLEMRLIIRIGGMFILAVGILLTALPLLIK